ncbi:MAG: hypothetical protein JO288_04530 [Hyphomicrobiales bacterium]|nr:hypothetical protein [Hyphomicrobiales bacterium]
MTAVDLDLAALAPTLSIIAASLTIAVTVGGLVVRSRDHAYLEGQINAKATATAEAVAELQRRVGVNETALAALRVEIAQQYVHVDMLVRTEERLLAAMHEVSQTISKLADRIDRAIDRREPH